MLLVLPAIPLLSLIAAFVISTLLRRAPQREKVAWTVYNRLIGQRQKSRKGQWHFKAQGALDVGKSS